MSSPVTTSCKLASSENSSDSRGHIITQLLSPLQRSRYPDNLQFSRGDLAARYSSLVPVLRSTWATPGHAAAIGVRIGGWHDFRHTPVRGLRRAGVNVVVISGVVGHKKVELAAKVYLKINGFSDLPTFQVGGLRHK
jgi:hypothetical protein